MSFCFSLTVINGALHYGTTADLKVSLYDREQAQEWRGEVFAASSLFKETKTTANTQQFTTVRAETMFVAPLKLGPFRAADEADRGEGNRKWLIVTEFDTLFSLQAP